MHSNITEPASSSVLDANNEPPSAPAFDSNNIESNKTAVNSAGEQTRLTQKT
jgi:hypothetical protein